MIRPIFEARELAGATLEALGRRDDAAIIRTGGGDDFPEVRVALSAMAATRDRLQLLERALRCYADSDFWDAERIEAALAFYDQGEIARSALDGKGILAPRD